MTDDAEYLKLVLTPIDLPSLRSVEMGDQCFHDTQNVILENLYSLSSITTGHNCFVLTIGLNMQNLDLLKTWNVLGDMMVTYILVRMASMGYA